MSAIDNRVAPHRLACEQLESRRNPAGNVTAFMSGGRLTLLGDAADNSVSIQQNAAGDLFLFGLNGTAINGQSAVYVGRGTISGLVVDTGQGNDYVEILGVATPGLVWVTTGDGSDGIFVGSVSAGQLHLDTQGGDDGVVTSTVFVAGTAEVSGGAGNDGYDYDGLFAGGGLFVHDFEVIH